MFATIAFCPSNSNESRSGGSETGSARHSHELRPLQLLRSSAKGGIYVREICFFVAAFADLIQRVHTIIVAKGQSAHRYNAEVLYL